MKLSPERVALGKDVVANRQNLASGVMGETCLAAFTPTKDDIVSFLALAENLTREQLIDCLKQVKYIQTSQVRHEEETGTIEFYGNGAMNVFVHLEGNSSTAHAFYRIRPSTREKGDIDA